MNERPTPETDAECFVSEGDFVTGDLARRLERHHRRGERREAVKPLNELTDAELSECFAVEVAGWRDIVQNPIYKGVYLSGFNDSIGKTESANCGSRWGCPMFSTSADAVLPWLYKRHWEVQQTSSSKAPIRVLLDHSRGPCGEATTFARAACIALIEAKRRDVK